ncbi:MAG TPA: class I SAM-dependent methyltransferase [Candidatus Acidoferrales bacterium]|nr:class I SAM-dependent methyltransferase [Candidatus Acidoferrales bacterium]
MAEFDVFAAGYEESLDHSVRIAGDTFDYFASYKAAYIACNIAPRGPGKILDYGCGVGLLSRHLRDRMPGKRVDGFDVSAESIARVDRDLLSQGIFTSDLGEVGHAYDVVVLANVLHHVKPSERQDLICQAVSRLSPGGKLVVFEHNPLNPLTRWVVSQCVFDGDAILLYPRETRRYFRKQALERLRRKYVVFFPNWLRWFRPLEPLLAWCPLGAQYAMVATNPSAQSENPFKQPLLSL